MTTVVVLLIIAAICVFIATKMFDPTATCEHGHPIDSMFICEACLSKREQIERDVEEGRVCYQCGCWNDDFVAHLEKEAPGGGHVTNEWQPPGRRHLCLMCRVGL